MSNAQNRWPLVDICLRCPASPPQKSGKSAKISFSPSQHEISPCSQFLSYLCKNLPIYQRKYADSEYRNENYRRGFFGARLCKLFQISKFRPWTRKFRCLKNFCLCREDDFVFWFSNSQDLDYSGQKFSARQKVAKVSVYANYFDVYHKMTIPNRKNFAKIFLKFFK